MKRRMKKQQLWIRDSDGILRGIQLTNTVWFKLYVDIPILSTHLQKLFRNCFRLCHHSYLELLSEMRGGELFSGWINPDSVGSPPLNMVLLLSGALRYIGRGWTFNDMEEATAISREAIYTFFHKFLLYGSTVLYHKHVTVPATTIYCAKFESVFSSAGFNGYIESSDSTHIGMHSCASWAAHNHLGHKLNIPSRTYNVTVTHWRQILDSTSGHQSTWNNKTIVLLDELVRGVNTGDIYGDNEFKLLERDKKGNLIIPDNNIKLIYGFHLS